jgi:hypothetical protein
VENGKISIQNAKFVGKRLTQDEFYVYFCRINSLKNEFEEVAVVDCGNIDFRSVE